MRLLISVFLLLSSQTHYSSTSPNGRFRASIDISRGSDLQVKYSIKLTDTKSKRSSVQFSCTRRDLGRPNIYWDKDSKFVLVEDCSDNFKSGSIKIINLGFFHTDFELHGLIGNADEQRQHFDSANGVLIYFDSSSEFLTLSSFEISTKQTRKLFGFSTPFDMELPTVKRVSGKRELTVEYFNPESGQQLSELVE